MAGMKEYVFEGRDHGHISTRQIQRLLDGVAEKAGLQEACQHETKKEDLPQLRDTALIDGRDDGID